MLYLVYINHMQDIHQKEYHQNVDVLQTVTSKNLHQHYNNKFSLTLHVLCTGRMHPNTNRFFPKKILFLNKSCDKSGCEIKEVVNI